MADRPEAILTWNFTNMITIIVMAAVGFLALTLIAQLFHNWRGTGSDAPVNAMSPAGGVTKGNATGTGG